MKPIRSLTCILALSAAFSAIAPGQDAAPAQSLPSDPAALLQLASGVNGLHGANLQPWHVRATWQTLDAKSKVKEQGTWEEWWAGPDEFKTELSGPGFQQTRWATSRGDFISGDSAWPSWGYSVVAQMFTKPLPDQEVLAKMWLARSQEKDHGVAIECVSATSRSPQPGPPVGKYCFVGSLPAVRIEGTAAMQTIFDALVRFQGQYLARGLRIYRVDMPAIQVHLDQLGPLQPALRDELTPPTNAIAASPWEHSMSGHIKVGNRISGKLPEYPEEAKYQRVQGTVTLFLVIGTDGAVHDVEVIGGPAALQQTSVDSVKTWRFTPYTLDGEPIEAETQVNVAFRLGQ